MINALIIDDEEHNRSVLKTILENMCTDIRVVGEAASADEGYQKIQELDPNLVFLDIKMPKKSGFDLLRMFNKIDFAVVFVTAFDRYAIRAFEFNALGYILKPIDQIKLVKVVEKAVERIKNSTREDFVLHFVKTLSDRDVINKLSVHHNDKVIFINLEDIVHIETNEDNTTIALRDKNRYYSSKRLTEFENVLEQAGMFLRISKSVIININYITAYTKGELCILDMKDGGAFEVSRRRKSEIIKKLKSR